MSANKPAINSSLPPTEPPDGLPQPRRGWALASLVVAISMTALGGTMLNLALPAMARDFAVDPADIVWVVSSYQLVIAILLFPMGALGERIGHGAVYASGLALFTVASLACALTLSFPTLILARIAQGIGSAAVLSVNIALFRFIFPRHLLGRSIGYNTMTVALASTAGPTVGALVLSVAPWQWLFLVNVPIGIFGALIAWLTLPPTPRTHRAFDGAGTGLIALSVGLLILGLDGIGRHDPLPILTAQFAGSLVFFIWLFRHQVTQAAPMLPLDLLRMPVIRLSGATAISSYIVQSLCYIALPFYFHDTLGLDLLAVGLLMTPWPLAVAAGTPMAGRLSDRYSAGVLGTAGLSLLTLGLLLLVLLPAEPAPPDILWRMALCGFGFGFFQTPNSKAIIAHAPANRTGGASAIQSGSRILGQSAGAALVAAVFGGLPELGPLAAIYLALVFAALATVVSSLRLGQHDVVSR